MNSNAFAGLESRSQDRNRLAAMNNRTVKITDRFVTLMDGNREVHSFGWSNVRELSQWNHLVKNWIHLGKKHDGVFEYK